MKAIALLVAAWLTILLTWKRVRWALRDALRVAALRSESPRVRAWHWAAGVTRRAMLASPPSWPRATLARWSIHARRRGNEIAFRGSQRRTWQRYIGRLPRVEVR